MAANTSEAEWVTVHGARLEIVERGQGRPSAGSTAQYREPARAAVLSQCQAAALVELIGRFLAEGRA